ncbi:MAG: serine/threonine-protein phosphatase [Methylotenera sp.]|nr:serine/threonine-protein phosphatase [Oligoflexia bacterium]
MGNTGKTGNTGTPDSSGNSASSGHFHVGYATNIGMKRQQNQDSVGSFPENGLYIVADGMGGHRGGETASAMAVELIAETFQKNMKSSRANPGIALTEAFRKASGQILKRSSNEENLKGMGTTATALYAPVHGQTSSVYIGHVGDSRCYLLQPRENIIWQITRDHSLVQEKLRAGMINREQAKTDRMKNVITRSVGFDSALQVDIYEYDCKPGDCFLLCSDGLSGLVEDAKILEIISGYLMENAAGTVKDSTPPSPSPLAIHEKLQAAVDRLIETANSNGGDDNITALLIQRDG